MPRRKPTVKAGATFFRSYIESVEDLPEDIQKEWCYAILMKLFYGTDPYFLCSENVPTDVLKGYWKLALPNINTSISRSKLGSKGGKQTGSKTQAKGKQKPSNKDKDKERNIREENIYRSFKHLSITKEEVDQICKDMDTSQETVDHFIDSVENFKNNKNYISLNLTVRNWMKRDGYPKPKESPNWSNSI